MVCMTLSIGTKVKEKMELETAADAAAYSQAVATARTYNSISVLNRALMSNMVAMAGVQSLISWSSFYRARAQRGASDRLRHPQGPVRDHRRRLRLPRSPCLAGVRVRHPGRQRHQRRRRTSSSQEEQPLKQVFDSLDSAAGLEARGLQICSVSDRQQEMFDRLLNETSPAARRRSPRPSRSELNKGKLLGPT